MAGRQEEARLSVAGILVSQRAARSKPPSGARPLLQRSCPCSRRRVPRLRAVDARSRRASFEAPGGGGNRRLGRPWRAGRLLTPRRTCLRIEGTCSSSAAVRPRCSGGRVRTRQARSSDSGRRYTTRASESCRSNEAIVQERPGSGRPRLVSGSARIGRHSLPRRQHRPMCRPAHLRRRTLRSARRARSWCVNARREATSVSSARKAMSVA